MSRDLFVLNLKLDVYIIKDFDTWMLVFGRRKG